MSALQKFPKTAKNQPVRRQHLEGAAALLSACRAETQGCSAPSKEEAHGRHSPAVCLSASTRDRLSSHQGHICLMPAALDGWRPLGHYFTSPHLTSLRFHSTLHQPDASLVGPCVGRAHGSPPGSVTMGGTCPDTARGRTTAQTQVPKRRCAELLGPGTAQQQRAPAAPSAPALQGRI